MKLTIKNILHTPSPSFTALIEQHLAELGKKLQIDEAHIAVERMMDSSPPFRISAHLVTPGPDVSSEAVDHTLRAALQKLVQRLSDSIDRRHAKQSRRLRTSFKTAAPAQLVLACSRG